MKQHLPQFRNGRTYWATLLFSLVVVLAPLVASANCLLLPIELSTRVNVSEAVFEGEIIKSEGFLNPDETMVHTAHLVRVFRVFKGNITSDFVVVTVQGGVVENRGLTVTPSLGLKTGDMGLFIGSSDFMPNPYSKYRAFRPFGTANGFIRYNVEDDRATEAFYNYEGIQTDLYSKIESLTGRRHKVIAPWINKKSQPNDGTAGVTMVPNSITFTPASVPAGTFTTLTINGIDFGTQGPNSRVQFRNADDGGVTYITASNLHIISWTTTQIRIIVPNGAGTGDIRVRNALSQEGTSAGTLTIPYNIINVELPQASPTDIYHQNLQDLNGAGGHTFSYNNTRGSAGNTMASNVDAKAAFERALQTWRCATGVNFSMSPTTTAADYTNGADTVNCVSFDYTGNFITALGVCFSSWTFPGAPCTIAGGRTGFKTRIDLVFRHPTDNPSWTGPQTWHFLPSAPLANRFDFESVALHELGHGHELDHVNVGLGAGVMRFAIAPASSTRTLTPDDIAAGLWVMARSTNVAAMEACNRLPHQSVLGAPLCQQTTPAGPGTCSINASVTSGCSPLTVNFTGSTTGAVPSAWYWDVQNAVGPPTAAKIEYYGSTASHTYTAPGMYVMKLTVGTANGYCTSTVTIDVGTSFTATLSPTGPVSTCTGQTLTATSDPAFTYQWFLDSNPVGSNQNTHNANVTGSYTLRVSQGSCILNLGPVVVTVLPPSIAGSASAPATLCAGTNSHTLTVTGQSGNVIRWEQSTDNFVTNTVTVPASASATLNLNNLSVTRQYRAVVQNGICAADFTNAVTVTVVPQTAGGTVGNNQTICSGSNTATLNLTGHIGSILRWESSNDNFVTNTITVPNSTASLTLNNLAATTWYRAVVQSGFCNVLESGIGQVVVNPSPPVINAITGPNTACQLTNSSYSVNSVATVTYDWTISPAGPSLSPSGNMLQVAWATAPATNYVITMTPRIGSCIGSPRSIAVVLNLAVGTPAPVVASVGIHCVGQQVTYSIPPVTGASTYSWTNSCGSWAGNSTSPSIVYTANTVQSCNITVTATGVCGTSAPSAINVTSNTNPTQPSVISGVTPICQNNVSAYNVILTPNVTYTWTTTATQALITSGQGTNNISLNWRTTPPAIVPLCVTPSNVCGNGPVSCIDVDVRALPAQPATITGPVLICEQNNATYTVPPVANVTYTWAVTPAGPTLTPNGTSASITWNMPGVYDISVTPNNFCGNGSVRTLRVNVEGRPIANAGIDRVICSSAQLVLGAPTINGNWRCFSCPGNATFTNFGVSAYINNLEPGLTYELEYEVRGQVCPATTDRMTVLNDAPNAGTISTPGPTVCGGSSVTLTLQGFRGNIVRWEFSIDNLATFTPIANTSPVLTFTPTANTHFRAVVRTPSGNCADALTAPVFQRVVPQPVASANPATQSICRNDAYAYGVLPLAGTGIWSVVGTPPNAAPTVSTAQGTGLFNNLAVPGTYRFRYLVIGEAPCGSDETFVEVVRLPDPIPANAGLDGASCDGNFNLQGNATTTGTMTWAFVSGPIVPSMQASNSNLATVSGMTKPGRYVFSYTITEGACPPSVDYVFVDRVMPVNISAGPDFSICNGTIFLRGSAVPVGGIASWSVVSHPGFPPTINGSGQNVVLILPNQTGPYVLRYEITGAACAPVSDEITVTRDAQPSQPVFVNSPVSVCSANSASLEVQPHSGNPGSWSFMGGPSQASLSSNGLTTVISGMTIDGTYRVRYTVSSACGTTFSEVNVIRSSNVNSVFAGTDRTICEISSALLVGSQIPTGGTASWEFIGGPCVASVETFGRFGSAVGMSCAGVFVFRYTVTPPGNGCQAASDVVRITRTAAPTTPTINGPTTICNSVATLRGNIPTIGNGSWSLISVPNNALPSLNPQSEVLTVSGMTVPGQYVFRWTIANPPCTPKAADHTIQVGQQILGGNVTGLLSACLGDNLTLTLTGSQGNISRWERSSDGGNTWSPVFVTTPIYSATPQNAGDYCYRAVLSDPVCGTATSGRHCVQIGTEPAKPDAGPDRTICTSSVFLQTNPLPNAVLQWDLLTTPAATAVSISTFGSNAFASGLNALGLYCFRVTNTSSCGTSSDDVCITVLPALNAGVVSGPQTVCRTSPTQAISYSLSGHQTDVVRWEYSVDLFITTVQTIASTSTTVSLPSSVNSGFVCVRAVVGNACSQNIAMTTPVCTQISNGNFPAPNAGADFTTCAPNFDLTGSAAPQGVDVLWEFVSGPSTPNMSSTNTPVINVTASAFGEYTFRYVHNSPGCQSKTDIITVNYANNQATGNGSIAGSTTVCGQPNNGSLVLSGHSGTITRWESSTDNWVNITPYNNTTHIFNWFQLSQTTQFRAVIATAGCPITYSLEATVLVTAPPSVAQAPATLTVCGTSVVLSGTPPTVGTASWRLVSAPPASNVSLNSSGSTAFVSGLTGVGSHLFAYDVVNPPCAPSTAFTVVQVFPAVVTGAISTAQTVCAGSNAGSLQLQAYQGTIVRWERSTDNFGSQITMIPNTSPQQTFANLSQTTWFRAVVRNNQCPSVNSPAVAITVNAMSMGGVAGPNAQICATNGTSVVSLTGAQGNVQFWEMSEDNGQTWQQIPNSNSSPFTLTNIVDDVLVRASVRSGVCPPALSAPASIEVDQPTVGGFASAPATVCSGSNSGLLNLNNHVGQVIRWEMSTDGYISVIPIPNTTTVQVYTNIRSTTWYRAVVQNGACAQEWSVHVGITVDPASQTGTLIGDNTICRGNNSGTLEIVGGNAQVLHWERSVDNFQNFDVLPITARSLPYTNLLQSAQYRVRVQGGNCPAVYTNPVSITVEIAAMPGVVSAPASFCQTGSGSVQLIGGFGPVIRWEISTDNFQQSLIPAVSTSSTFTYNNYTQSQWIRVVQKAGNCPEVFSNSVKVTIDQPANGGTLAGGTTACNGQANGTLVLSNYQGAVAYWEKDIDPNFSNPQRVNIAADQLTYNESQSFWFRAVVSGGACGNVNSPAQFVWVLPSGQGGTVVGAQNVCFDAGSGTLQLLGQAGTIMRWERSNDCQFLNITTIPNQNAVQNYSGLQQTTCYRAVISSGGVCPPVFSQPALITVHPQIVVDVVETMQGCNNLGTIRVSATGGDGSFTYSIVPAFQNPNTTGLFNNLPLGTYTVEVNDGTCSQRVVYNLNQAPARPFMPTFTQITSTSAVVNWTAVPPVVGMFYTLRFRTLNSPSWAIVNNLQGTQHTLSGLASGSVYEVEMAYRCPSSFINSTFSQTTTFATLNPKAEMHANSAVELRLYPNPNRGRFTLELTTASEEEVQLTLTDLQGRRVFSDTYTSTMGTNVWPIDPQGLSSGLYLLRIESSSLQQTLKVVVE